MRPTLATTAVVVCWMLGAVSAPAEPPVAYRRVYVPADNPSAWPRGDQAFLPVETSDFEAWVARANQPAAAATVSEAHYEARYEGGELRGTGSWQVDLTGRGTARIKLTDPALQLANAHWREAPEATVRLGWWPVDGSDEMERGLEISRSGILEFDWQTNCATTAAGCPEYSLHFPDAARAQLVLDLPAGKLPAFTGAVTLHSPAQPQDGGRWTVALSPHGSATLQLQDSIRRPTPSAAAPTVHQELRYHLSKRGSELRARLRIDVGDAALSQLRIALPAGMKLVEAKSGERPVAWRNAESPDGGTSLSVILELGSKPTEQVVSITLVGWGTAAVGESLKLSMLSVAGTFWTSGRIDVDVDDELEPLELTPVDCVQASVAAVATGVGPARRISFNAFAPSAAVNVVLAERPVRGSVRTGTALDVGNPRIAARTVADVSVDRGSVRRLSADVLPGWSIDAVETVPADALGEWYVDRSHEPQRFHLQLHQSVAADRPLRIVISARRESTDSVNSLTVSKLNPLAWRELSQPLTLLQLRAAERYELEVAADLQAVAGASLSTAERALFAEPDKALVCDLGASPPGAAIRLVPKKGTYDATIQIDAELRPGRLRRSYRVECRPRGSGVDHVLVYLNQSASSPLEWFEEHSQSPLSAQRMPESDPRLGGLPRGGELWLVDLGRLYARPFAITATSTQAWPQRDRVPLAALPDAASQQGRVTVSSTAVELPTIVAQGMSPTSLPIDSPGDAAGDAAAVRGVYRFQPTRFYDAGQPAQLWVGPPALTAEGAKLIAVRIDVDSRFAADGSGWHRATYQLQNLGARSLRMTLPSGVRLESARVDGEPVAATSQDTISLNLPQRAKFPLELELSSRQRPLASGDQLCSPLPEGAVSIVAGRWQVSLPHGFEVVDQLSATNAEPTWREAWFGPLARQQHGRPFNPFTAADWNAMWAGLSRAFSTPALADSRASEEAPSLPLGWHTADIAFFARPPAAITIAHRVATSAVGLALFLGCAIVPVLFRARGLAIVLLAAAAAAASLFLPAFHAPVGAAMTMGFAAAALWHGWKRIGRRSPAALALVALAVVGASSALAAERPAVIEQVLIPLDASGRPAGTKSFVSSDFLRELMQRSSTAPTDSSWLIADMRCDGELISGQDPQPAVHPSDWTLTLEIETLSRDVAIRLPLGRDEANWPATASVDGMPSSLEWAASGRGSSIRVAEPGRHRVAIVFVPHVEAAAGGHSIALTLPKVPGAAVSVAAPAGLVGLHGGDRPWVRHGESNRTMWRSELDASGRLTVAWSAADADGTAAGSRGVDQFSDLRIQPEALLLTTRFRRHERGDWPATIELTLADHWELLPDETGTQTTAAESLSEGRRRIGVRSEREVADSREIVLRFRSSHGTALGRVLIPNVQTSSFNVDSHVIAINCEGGLECVPSFVPPVAAAPAVEFAISEATANPPPQILLDASKLKPSWYLTVRPRESVSSYEDRLSLAVSKRQLRVNYCCEVTPQGADRFGWSLAIPEEMEVERVEVMTGDEPVPVDWTRLSPTRLAIRFSRATTLRFEVVVSGSLPLSADGRVAVPQIAPPRLPRSDQIVALYRDENVLANWQLPPGMPEVEAVASQPPRFGEPIRFVGAYRIAAESIPNSHLSVEANRPIVSGDTLTAVSRTDDAWTAKFHAQLRVDRGVIDVLRLQIPRNWSGPFVVTPTANSTMASAAGGRVLVIGLPQAVPAGGTIQLSVESPLTFADGEAPVAPRIQLTHAGKRREFLALPVTVGGQQAAWTQRGVAPAELPTSLRQQAAVTADAETLRVAADSIGVALRPRATQASAANVRLAETVVRRARSGGMVAETRFVIAPEGLTHCTVQLPDDHELVWFQLDGHAALARPLDPRTWQIQLGPPDLPQVLEVVTRTDRRQADRSSAVELERPILKNSGESIPVEFSLWALRHTGAVGNPQVSGGARVTPAEFAAARFDRLLSISQSATRSVIESPLVDGYNWFARWSSRLDAAAREAGSLERHSAGASKAIRVPQPDESLSETTARYEAWLDQINEIFAAAEWSTAGTPTPEAGSFSPESEVETGLADQVCIISAGNDHHVLVKFFPPGVSSLQTRALLLIALAAVGMVAVWLARRPWAIETAERWPEAAGLVLGILAWAWLRPSALGLAVATVSAVLLVRRALGAEKAPRHGSSNQPSEITEQLA